jgi:hypothetical protein
MTTNLSAVERQYEADIGQWLGDLTTRAGELIRPAADHRRARASLLSRSHVRSSPDHMASRTVAGAQRANAAHLPTERKRSEIGGRRRSLQSSCPALEGTTPGSIILRKRKTISTGEHAGTFTAADATETTIASAPSLSDHTHGKPWRLTVGAQNLGVTVTRNG